MTVSWRKRTKTTRKSLTEAQRNVEIIGLFTCCRRLALFLLVAAAADFVTPLSRILTEQLKVSLKLEIVIYFPMCIKHFE